MKTRVIHTKFWSDNYIIELTHLEKLAFLYFISNERIGLIGAYEVSNRIIQVELNITSKQLEDLKTKFTRDRKIFFVDGYVILCNSKKYSDYSKGNENQQKAYNREFDHLPESVKKALQESQNPTSPQLVDNQSPTSCQLDIIYKSKIINHKSKTKKAENENVENSEKMWKTNPAEEFISHFNAVFGTKYKATQTIKDKIKLRLSGFTIEDLKVCVDKAKADEFYSGGGSNGWCVTPEYILRNDDNPQKLLNLQPRRGNSNPLAVVADAEKIEKYKNLKKIVYDNRNL